MADKGDPPPAGEPLAPAPALEALAPAAAPTPPAAAPAESGGIGSDVPPVVPPLAEPAVHPPEDGAAADAPPAAAAQPAAKSFRAWFGGWGGGKKAVAGEAVPVPTGGPAPEGVPPEVAALPPSNPAEGAGEPTAGGPVEVPWTHPWPKWDRHFFYGWPSKASPGSAAGAPAGDGAASAGGGGAGAWLAWSGWAPAPPVQPEPWCRDYVKLGRWLSLVFLTWQELCFTAGVHPFTGASIGEGAPQDGQAAEPAASPGPKPRGKAAVERPAGGAVALGARSQLQRAFLQACGSVQEQLVQETAGMMLVAVLLAVAAAGLIGALANKGNWGGADYASYVLLLLSAASSLTHLAIGACVWLAAAGRPPRAFLRLLLSFEPLLHAGTDAFFVGLNCLFAGVLVFAFWAAWARRDAIGNSAAAAQVSVLFLALAAIFYIPAYITGRWMLRCQDKSDSRSRVVSKAALLSSLEPLLSWSFAGHTNPPAFRTTPDQSGQWEPLRRYCEAHSYEVYREFELLPAWQAWPLWAANHLLSALGPTSLLRLRPVEGPFQPDVPVPKPAPARSATGEAAQAGTAAATAAAAAAGEAPPTFTVEVHE